MVDIYFLADGKNLNCCYCCLRNDEAHSTFHCDTRSILQRLCIMLVDPEARHLISRHILLINHYLGLTNHKFKILDAAYLGIILEYLCKEVECEPLYETPLQSLLLIIQKPPVVLLTSHSELYQQDLCDYFTFLGNCFLHLRKHEYRFLIISAINNTMYMDRKEDNYVDQQHCIKALENSGLAERFSAALAEIKDKRDAGNVLNLFIHLTMISDQFCLIMYHENFVERLLNLIPLFLNEPGTHTELHRTGFLLLKILATTIVSEKYSPLVINDQALSNLRTWFKNIVLNDQKKKRNLVMTVILAVLKVQQNLDLASCHLLEDIILLSVSPKYARQNTWTKNFKLNTDSVDFEFKKLLLIALYELFDYCPTTIVCEKLDGVIGLSELLDLKLWTQLENNIYLMYCLHLIPRVATFLHQEVIKYDLLSKMIQRGGKLVQNSDCDEVFFYLIQSIYSLTLNDNLTEYFKEKNIVTSLLDYCETILEMPSWTIRVQLVLQYTLNSITNITSRMNAPNYKCLALCHPSTLSIDLIRRYINPCEKDSILDPSLIVSIADFIWMVQIKGSASKINFIKSGGLYHIMDALQKEVMTMMMGCGSVVLLALLSDLLKEELAITQAVTWKGSIYSNLISMLCDIWRSVEKHQKVKRYKDTIKDCEAPLMGQNQASIECKNPASCPPLLEMMGCLRPKIFSIITLLLKHNKHLVEITEDTYSALFRKLSTRDRVTFEVIKYYEFIKEGEIWQRMLYTMKQNTAPLAGDELLLHTLITKHITCARNIQNIQIQLLDKESKKELEEEKNLYEKIKLSKIIEDLDKYRELEKNLIIKNNTMKLLMKKVELSQIDDALQTDWIKYGYIRTFNNRNNTTTTKMGRDILTSGTKHNN